MPKFPDDPSGTPPYERPFFNATPRPAIPPKIRWDNIRPLPAEVAARLLCVTVEPHPRNRKRKYANEPLQWAPP